MYSDKYKDCLILAPMVRVGTLPMRLLALKYGADLAYTEEVIDFKMLESQRVVNTSLGTIDFVLPCGTIAFRTCEEERQKVIFQIGTADPERALKVAKMIENDVSGIDVNMGCPKEYSTKGGMGAALLTKPDLAAQILTTLVNGTILPVTCKIRLLKDKEATLNLVKRLAATGISAITVHGRRKDERPRHPNKDDMIAEIAQALDIPVIANGGSCDTIRSYESMQYFRHVTKASSVMVARAAMYNPAIFLTPDPSKPPPTVREVIQDYVRLAIRYDLYVQSGKYCVQQMLHSDTECEAYRQNLSAIDNEELSRIWGLYDYYLSEIKMRSLRSENGSENSNGVAVKRPHSPDYDNPASVPTKLCLKETNLMEGCFVDVKELCRLLKVPQPDSTTAAPNNDNAQLPIVFGEYRFVRKYFPVDGSSPKQILHEHCKQTGRAFPQYLTYELKSNKLFFAAVILGSDVFVNVMGDKNKRYCEQSVACLALHHLKISNGNLNPSEESLMRKACSTALS